MNSLEKRLLNEFQRDFPLSPTPYADIAARLDVTEAEVLDALRRLSESGAISRVGPVIRPHAIGASTLAALRVPPERLEAVAAIVNGYPEVNHNYEREHAYNLWFVLTAPSKQRLHEVLRDIERRTNLSPINLPLVRDYHIDLGFELKWN